MPKEPPGFWRRAWWLPPPFIKRHIKRHNEVPTMDRPKPLPGYLGGNCEFGTGVARLAGGARSVNPVNAPVMSAPSAPHGTARPLGGVQARQKTGRLGPRSVDANLFVVPPAAYP